MDFSCLLCLMAYQPLWGKKCLVVLGKIIKLVTYFFFFLSPFIHLFCWLFKLKRKEGKETEKLCFSWTSKIAVLTVEMSTRIWEVVIYEAFLFRCGTRPNEWGTQWDSNSILRTTALSGPEKKFLFGAKKPIFQTCVNCTSCQRPLESLLFCLFIGVLLNFYFIYSIPTQPSCVI